MLNARVFKDLGLPKAIRTDSRSARGGKHVAEKTWLVSFMQYDLGFFDHETCRIKERGKPLRRGSVTPPMSPVSTDTDVFGIDPESVGAPRVMNLGAGGSRSRWVVSDPRSMSGSG
jgi:hypothetical protein